MNDDGKAKNQKATMNEKAQKQRTLNIKQVFLKKLDFKSLVNPIDYQHLNHVESVVNININHEQRSKNNYLITLAIELEGYDDDKRANKIFNVLVEMFGIFEIGEFDSSERSLLIYGFCANTLFPYVRSHISLSLSLSGFKSILLSPINFEQLYLSKLKEKQALEKKAKSSKAKETDNGSQNNLLKNDNDPSNPKIH